MKRFFYNGLISGLFQYGIGFFLLGLVCAAPKKVSIYLVIMDSCLFLINVILGTRNFINFYKSYEENLRFRAMLNQQANDALEILRGNLLVPEIPREIPREIPKVSRFAHYRKLFLGG